MTRMVLTIILPFLAPTLLYLIWTGFARRRALAQGHTGEVEIQVPWFWLVAVGAVLAIFSLLAGYLLIESGAPGSTYVPAHIEDGKLVPGTFLPKEE